MTYKQGVLYAAVLGVPCLVFDLLVRIPPLFHVEAAHTLAQVILFPGWQIMHWLTSGLTARNLEYELLIPVVIILVNLFAWGAVVWSAGNVWECRRSSADEPRNSGAGDRQVRHG